MTLSSPAFTLRPATAEDATTIRNLVWQAKLNPSGLKWPRFTVITPAEPPSMGTPAPVIACGQVKPHVDGSQELASIVVAPDWRGHGLARRLLEHLLAAHPGEMHLMCLSSMGPFYEKFGFAAAKDEDLSPYFRRIKNSSQLFAFVMPKGESLFVMHKGHS